MKTHIYILIIITTLSMAFSVLAQYSPMLQTQVSIELNPENPGPNQAVDVTIDSYMTDLNASTVTFKINGEVKRTGKGIKTFSFTTGGLNSTTELTVLVQTREGEKIENTYKIKPVGVDLLWQTEGYTPPFYKGKTLFSHQNRVKFIALPHMIGSNGQEIPAKDLIYKWTRNGTVLGDFSGYGKNTYTMIPSVISRPLEMEVEVTSPTESGVGYASIVAEPIEPFIVFYEKDPMYGIQLQKAMSEYSDMKNLKEITVIAVPYFFGVDNSANTDLTYKWSINGNKIDDGNIRATTRVFRQIEGTSGRSYISLSIENSNKILQYASKGFYLSFGDK